MGDRRTAGIIRGPRALALHLRRVLRECGANGPWFVRRADIVSKCADEWCIDVSLTNSSTGMTKFAIVAVGKQERISISAEESERVVMRRILCDCLAAEGIQARVLCGARP